MCGIHMHVAVATVLRWKMKFRKSNAMVVMVVRKENGVSWKIGEEVWKR